MYVPLLTVGPLEFGPVAWHRSSFVPPARSSSAVRCISRPRRTVVACASECVEWAVAPGLCAVACVQWPMWRRLITQLKNQWLRVRIRAEGCRMKCVERSEQRDKPTDPCAATYTR